MKNFFDIKRSYRFEIYDLTAIITILNVTFIILGYWWAPILGVINCAICILVQIRNHMHINSYLTQISLIILNLYFLGIF